MVSLIHALVHELWPLPVEAPGVFLPLLVVLATAIPCFDSDRIAR
ncbi:hypothetical protein [Cryptosporangium arvum]|uniref:Uncharacterized protein n=1 Tax=Cryptosporangium arvum DSM 44712 TaxID=927661 RepID=A0A010Z4A9_9ACTN|nr:hypothetical protein [Cryptosporangium arvum]EXG82218.1 hypothetical protein CryarDRAFT_3377 [Cryptosporangium arvum DSM 44712]